MGDLCETHLRWFLFSFFVVLTQLFCIIELLVQKPKIVWNSIIQLKYYYYIHTTVHFLIQRMTGVPILVIFHSQSIKIPIIPLIKILFIKSIRWYGLDVNVYNNIKLIRFAYRAEWLHVISPSLFMVYDFNLF